MDYPSSRAASVAAAILLLGQAVWLARPASIAPAPEPGLGTPPPLGRPAPLSVIPLKIQGVESDAVRGASEEEAVDHWRDAPLDTARLTSGRDGDFSKGLGPPRGNARTSTRGDAWEAPRRDPGTAPPSRATAVANHAGAAATRVAAENAARARQSEPRIASGRESDRASNARQGANARETDGASPWDVSRARSERDGGRSDQPRYPQGRASSLFESFRSVGTDPLEDERELRERSKRNSEQTTRRLAERRGAHGFKPLLLKSSLGAGCFHPPAADLEPPPTLLNLPARRPSKDSSGKPTSSASATLAQVESLDPKTLPKDRRIGAHWDNDEWHDGAVRGIDTDGAWLWTYRDGSRIWALAGNPVEPLLRHDGAWWMKSGGVWFVIHEGEPWALRDFSDWNARGFFEPSTGTQIIYSADYARAAVITPGGGAQVFDARTGRFLGEIPQNRMPPTRRPLPPRSLPDPQ